MNKILRTVDYTYQVDTGNWPNLNELIYALLHSNTSRNQKSGVTSSSQPVDGHIFSELQDSHVFHIILCLIPVSQRRAKTVYPYPVYV